LTPEHAKEPAFRLPWQAVILGLLVGAGYAAQLGYGAGSPRPAAALLGLSPRELWSGGGSGLFTYVFLNGGLLQAGLAVAATVILSAPLARRLPGVTGFFGLLSFFLLCGAAGGLVFAGLDPDGQDVLIGSSAAVSGLLASAVRTAGGRRGVAPLWSPLLLAIAGVWLAANAAAAFTDALGSSAFNEYGWQAHVGGFVAGALLVGPWTRLFGERRPPFDSQADLRDPDA
jgi:membrane associated rhomboid family serine protease